MFLYRVSTKKTDGWSRKEPKPVYFVARSKQEAEQWANEHLVEGLSVSKVTCLGEQISGVCFSSSNKG